MVELHKKKMGCAPDMYMYTEQTMEEDFHGVMAASVPQFFLEVMQVYSREDRPGFAQKSSI